MTKKSIAQITILILLFAGLYGCSGSTTSVDITGEWKIDSYWKDETDPELSGTIKFNADNTFSLEQRWVKTDWEGKRFIGRGTWEKNGDTLKYTYNFTEVEEVEKTDGGGVFEGIVSKSKGSFKVYALNNDFSVVISR